MDAWTTPLERFDAWLVTGDRPATSRRLYRSHLNRLAAAFPAGPASVTADELVAWLASQTWARETRRSYAATLRLFFRTWGLPQGVVEVDPTLHLPRIKPAIHRPRPVAEETWRIAAACSDERTRLMIHLGAQAGLRRAEIARVHSSDLIRALDGWTLVVHGKGERDRLVPISRALAVELRQAGPGWIFPGPAGHLSPDHVGRVIRRALGSGAHTLRHRFATRLYAVSGDLILVQTMLGHASIETTRGYIALADGAARTAVEAVA